MPENISFGTIVHERRSKMGLTQNELARRVGCAPITIRKIEYDSLRPSVQMAELLALALNIPEEEQLGFVRMARKKERTTPFPHRPLWRVRLAWPTSPAGLSKSFGWVNASVLADLVLSIAPVNHR